MNIFFFMAGLHLKAQPLWGYWDNSGVDGISQYPFLSVYFICDQLELT